MERDSTPSIFTCYAHRDEPLGQQLEKHLRLLQEQGTTNAWPDRLILPDMDRIEAMDSHLNRASVILLLISSDFLASDYCYGVEMRRAMERHERGEALVIPILLRPAYWQDTPFAKLRVLPSNGEPSTVIRKCIDLLLSLPLL